MAESKVMDMAERIGNWLADIVLQWRIKGRKASYARFDRPYYATFDRWERAVFGENLDPEKYRRRK